MLRVFAICVALAGMVCSSVVGQMVLRVPEDYASIQLALAAAPAHATIDVLPGAHTGAIRIDRAVTLRTRSATDSRAVLCIDGTSRSFESVIDIRDGADVVLERIDIDGSGAIWAMSIGSSARVQLRACSLRGAPRGVMAADGCHVQFDDCLLDAVAGCVVIGADSTLVVNDSELTSGLYWDAVDVGTRSTARISGCVFRGATVQDAQEHTRGVSGSAGSSLYVRDTRFLGWFSLAVIGHQASVVDVEGCEVAHCGEGVVLYDSTQHLTFGRIVGNTFLELGVCGINLYGACSRVEISHNTIVGTTGRAIGIASRECALGGLYDPSHSGMAYFAGVLEGSANTIERNTIPLCPSYDSDFWPEGFFATGSPAP